MRRARWGLPAVVLGLALPISAASAQQAELPEGVTQAMIEEGQQIFGGPGICTACHGVNGEGTAIGPNLSDGEWLNSEGTYEALVEVIANGVPEPTQFPAPMPPKGGSQITDEQVRAVAAYVWTLSRSTDGQSDASSGESSATAARPAVVLRTAPLE